MKSQSELAVLVPVLGRPHRVRPLLTSLAKATVVPYRVLFLLDPGDNEEIEAVLAADCDFIVCGGNYAHKINLGISLTQAPLLFLGADDLDFRSGWLEAAKAKLAGGVEIVGVNDLIPRHRDHATHFLITRNYAKRPTIDGSSGPLHCGYAHWYVDDELIATAKARGVYAYAPEAVVEHLHPVTGAAPDDETYRRGRSQRHRDQRLFRKRSALWM